MALLLQAFDCSGESSFWYIVISLALRIAEQHGASFRYFHKILAKVVWRVGGTTIRRSW